MAGGGAGRGSQCGISRGARGLRPRPQRMPCHSIVCWLHSVLKCISQYPSQGFDVKVFDFDSPRLWSLQLRSSSSLYSFSTRKSPARHVTNSLVNLFLCAFLASFFLPAFVALPVTYSSSFAACYISIYEDDEKVLPFQATLLTVVHQHACYRLYIFCRFLFSVVGGKVVVRCGRIAGRGASPVLGLVSKSGMQCNICCLFVAFLFEIYLQFPSFLPFWRKTLQSASSSFSRAFPSAKDSEHVPLAMAIKWRSPGGFLLGLAFLPLDFQLGHSLVAWMLEISTHKAIVLPFPAHRFYSRPLQLSHACIHVAFCIYILHVFFFFVLF